MIEGCRAVTEYAQQFGIKTMIENHGYFCQDSDRVEKLINQVNHSNFGLLLDMGNFVCVDEEPEKAIGKLMPHAFKDRTAELKEIFGDYLSISKLKRLWLL